jgi:hypothetical protein
MTTHALNVLTNPTPLDTEADCMSYGGLVDRDTACGREVALWADAEVIATMQRAATKRRQRACGAHAA